MRSFIQIPRSLLRGYILLENDHPKKTNWIGFCIILVLSVLTVASDLLFVLQFLIPIFLTTFIFFIKKRGVMVTKFGIVFGASIGFGILLKNILISTDYSTAYDNPGIHFVPLSQLLEKVNKLVIEMNNENTQLFYLFQFYLLICLSLLLAVLLNKIRNKQTKYCSESFHFLSVYFLILVPVNFLGIVFKHPGLPLPVRYFIPLLLFPVYIGIPSFLLVYAKHFLTTLLLKRIMFTIISIMLLTVIVSEMYRIGSLADLTALNSNRSRYIHLARCIDERVDEFGLKNGLAPYALSRPITILSQKGVKTAQINGLFQPYGWMTNMSVYNDADFNFFIVNHEVTGTEVIKKFGPEKARFKCAEGIWVFVYEEAQLRNLF
jgi:hypothetical protein